MSRFLMLLLLGGVALAAGPSVSPALAAPAPKPFSQDLIELVRPTDLVGDGASPAEMAILALYADGSPIVGLKAKMTVSGGTATELVDAGGGLYTFTFTPAKVEEQRAATFAIKGKLPNKAPYDRSWTVAVSPPLTRQLDLAVSPPEITLGVDKSASLAFTLKGGDPRAFAAANLALAVSSGTVGNVTNLGGGQFSGLYTPPTGTTPQVALVTAVDAGDTTRTYAFAAVPLVVKADQAVTATPNARVILKVGGREFGPVPADAKGRAKVPVIIPPGVTQATRVAVASDGVVNEAPLDPR
jgi:hypothetical protein